MDVVICEGQRQNVTQGRTDVCSELDYVLDVDPDPQPLSALLDAGATFAAETTSVLCVDTASECLERLRFESNGFEWSLGLAQEAGAYLCDGAKVTLPGALGEQVWTYDTEAWTLSSGEGTALALREPSLPPGLQALSP